MAAEHTLLAASALGTGPSISATAPLDLLRPLCGRRLDAVAPLLAQLPLTPLDALTLGDLLSLSGRTEDPHLVLVLAGLLAALNDGSVCLRLTPDGLLTRPHAKTADGVHTHLQRFLRDLTAGAYAGLIDDVEALGSAPLIRVRGGGSPPRPDLLYFQRYFRHEERLKTRLEAFLDQGCAPLCEADRIDELIAALWRSERVIRLGGDRLPLTADPWQQAALRLVMTRGFAVVSGGPGTGKTSLMVNMLRLLAACGVDAGEIRLTAPTGRAAQRMREALQLYLPGIDAPTAGEKRLLEIEAGTLHRLLRYGRGRQGFHYHAGCPLPVRVVIVDEVSMIDLGMLDRLLQAIDPHRTRLILLGDKDQLPSVEAGAVFAEMVPPVDPQDGSPSADAGGAPAHRFSEHLVVLQNSYRSGRRLRELGERVNRGELPPLRPLDMAAALRLPADNFARVGHQTPAELEAIFTRWVDHHYLGDHLGDGAPFFDLAADIGGGGLDPAAAAVSEALLRLFEKLGQARILTIARRGPLGCVALNRLVMTYLVGRYGWRTDPATGLFNGAPVLVTRNEYARQLFNGDVGIALMDPRGSLRLYVQRGNNLISTPIQALGDWEPAFATTVHKSQGSEYTDVLLVFPGDPQHRLLSREIVYTGITRARKRLLMVAQPEEVQTALGHRIQRTTGLMWSGP